MKPIVFVTVQLVILGWTWFGHIRRDSSPVYKLLWAAALCGVIAFDVWYLMNRAYPGGFAW